MSDETAKVRPATAKRAAASGKRPRATARATPEGRARALPSVLSRDLQRLIERYPLWQRPGYLVRRVHQLHHALFLEECGAYDVTPVQYGLMTVLSARPDGDQQTLAAEVGLDRANVADVLNRLERRGLVKRRRGALDRRTVVARLTAEGERITRQMHAAMARAQERFLSPLDEGERDVFVKTLLRVIDANNRYGRAVLEAAEPRE